MQRPVPQSYINSIPNFPSQRFLQGGQSEQLQSSNIGMPCSL